VKTRKYAGPPLEKGDAVMSLIPPAALAVQAIIRDLADRKGLGNEWEQVDDDIREEIEKKWTDIVARRMASVLRYYKKEKREKKP